MTPPMSELTAKTIQVKVAMNGTSISTSSVWFQYLEPISISSISPNKGSIFGGTKVIIHGSNFLESKKLKCRFGNIDTVSAIYLTSDMLLCESPSHLWAGDIEVEITINGQDYTRSRQVFSYHEPLFISSIWPPSGYSTTRESVVNVFGIFPISSNLVCKFGNKVVIATLLNKHELFCTPPPNLPGNASLQIMPEGGFETSNSVRFDYLKEPSIISFRPTTGSIQGGSIVYVWVSNVKSNLDIICKFGNITSKAAFIEIDVIVCVSPPFEREENITVSVSSNGYKFSEPSSDRFEYSLVLDEGLYYTDFLTAFILPTPNGTRISKNSPQNFTLCDAGTFQPKSAQFDCLSCPVGYFCPDTGLSSPILCTAGHVCDELGLSSPAKKCPKGHYCNAGTKTSSLNSFIGMDKWEFDEESGLVSVNHDYLSSNSFENHSLHPPIGAHVIVERPFPCPAGLFCREGVSTQIHMPYNFSTPQKCYEGFSCPQGSSTPEGDGPCPTGHYCPSPSTSFICPVGHFCPGVGNVKPRACHPGSFNSYEGQSKCTLCDKGQVCPGWGRQQPAPCPAGFVCSSEGLSIPFLRCPPGYYCEEGTETAEIMSTLIGPKKCPPGVFCLGGVANNLTLAWIPSQPKGAISPQICTEGYFCGSNSSTPFGSGQCFAGHYCPPGTSYPLKVPPGSFASTSGSIVPVLCFPGTYSPIRGSKTCQVCPAGFSCQGYGTYVPRMCEAGSYRSMADSITCKMCPSGTFTPFKGTTDVSLCYPCPSGRVCGFQGMKNLLESSPCPAGHVCGAGTDRGTQYSHLCPAGHYCKEETQPYDQFRFDCHPGVFCPKGTPEKLRNSNLCAAGHFCPQSTSSEEPTFTRCPQKTTAISGSSLLYNCTIEVVDVCDKEFIVPNNPFVDVSYYSEHRYSTSAASNSSLITDSLDNLFSSGEVEVLAKIQPLRNSAGDMWLNDTVEVFRSCPSYFLSIEEETDIVVLGRNFQNTSALTCRFRNCINSLQQLESGKKSYQISLPCSDNVREISSSLSSTYFDTKGTYISPTRIICPIPKLLVMEKIVEEVSTSDACGYDSSGMYFYFQRCDGDDILTGICSDKGFKRVYSLILECTDEEKASSKCQNVPEIGYRLNPCLIQEATVEVSNNGKKFSGEDTFVPHAVGLDQNIYNTYRDHLINGTYSIFSYINNNVKAEIPSDDVAFHAMVEVDYDLCYSERINEEGYRPREEGWILLPFLHQVHMSFDFSHLPSYLNYDEHFKIALYARPSRCTTILCNNERERNMKEEFLPCSQPIELPPWLVDFNVNENKIINLTILALDDNLVKPEIHLLHGVYSSSFSFFQHTLTYTIDKPERSITINTFQGPDSVPIKSKRRLPPFLSWEENFIVMDHFFGIRYSSYLEQSISKPLNMPPRWSDFERGRVLLSVNITDKNDDFAPEDNLTLLQRQNFWENPFPSNELAKEATDTFRESFHGLYRNQDGTFEYDLEDIILPYLPFFSKCREFDSYIPFWSLVESKYKCQLPRVSDELDDTWWRRDFPPLPHQDDVVSIGPLDLFLFYPLSDWCERKLYCEYEENLGKPDITRRWFEAESGTSLFSIIRDPITYFDYAGRTKTSPGLADGGGQQWIRNVKSSDMFIPVKVNRRPTGNFNGDCEELCFPRHLSLVISYFQRDRYSKRIVDATLEFSDFDKNSNHVMYDLDVKFYPLDYRELVIKFAYGREIFLILFVLIGLFTVFTSLCFWILSRVTTRLENPPILKFSSRFWLTFPHALSGFLFGLTPIFILTQLTTFLLQGQSFIAALDETSGPSNRFKNFRRHYMDSKIDPDAEFSTCQGRMGLAFSIISIICMSESSKLFVPDLVVDKRKANSKVTHNWGREAISPNFMRRWKRSNLLKTSFFMCIILTLIVEWSFWNKFGTYIWEAIIALKFLNILMSQIIDNQLNESLLSAPVMTSLGMVQTLVTLSANDFMDFLLSYIVGLGFLILERMFTDPGQSIALNFISDTFSKIVIIFKTIWRFLFHRRTSDLKTHSDANLISSDIIEKSETVEPILDSYGSYCCDTMSLLYTPYVILLLMAYRDELSIPSLYGIKEQDMEYYLLFSLVIIPFQIIADIFIHGSQELFHGWKLYDYLMYARYRFLQRELRWKGLEDNLDECIDESLRSMDQMCFSSQFYMMLTLHVNGMLYLVLGIQMMIRAQFNLFGDPVIIILISYIALCAVLVKGALIWMGKLFRIWKTKHENTAWHAGIREVLYENLDHLDNVQGVRYEEYAMDQRLTSETFRHKFLKHNKSWLMDQLPDILSPRTLRRSRPYLIGQFSKIINKLNEDISSDSSTDDETVRKFTMSIITAPSRKMIKNWRMLAQRRIKLREIAQPLILKARNSHCEICLSRNEVQVEPLIDIEEL